MKHDRKLPRRVRYVYKEECETKLKYAHGIWGGINPRGEIELSFYTESDKIPAYAECVLGADGNFGPELVPQGDDEHTVIRTINNRVLLNYHTAHALWQWLEEHLESLEELEAFEGRGFMKDDDTGVEQ